MFSPSPHLLGISRQDDEPFRGFGRPVFAAWLDNGSMNPNLTRELADSGSVRLVLGPPLKKRRMALHNRRAGGKKKPHHICVWVLLSRW